MSNGGGNHNGAYFSQDYNDYTNNISEPDNLIYHRDACSGDSSEKCGIYTTDDYGKYDNLSREYLYYETAIADVDDPAFTSYSIWNGMYNCNLNISVMLV